MRAVQHRIESNAHPIVDVLIAQGRRGTWLAAQAGVSASYANLMIRGKRPAYPAFRAACALALGLDESVLFHNVDSEVAA